MDAKMSIAQKLAWEIQAQNDRGDASLKARMALEIAYGVSLFTGDQPEVFSAAMSFIIEQVTDSEMKRQLRFFERRGLK